MAKVVSSLAVKISGNKQHIQELLAFLTQKFVVVRSSEYKEAPEEPDKFILYVSLLSKDVIEKVK